MIKALKILVLKSTGGEDRFSQQLKENYLTHPVVDTLSGHLPVELLFEGSSQEEDLSKTKVDLFVAQKYEVSPDSFSQFSQSLAFEYGLVIHFYASADAKYEDRGRAALLAREARKHKMLWLPIIVSDLLIEPVIAANLNFLNLVAISDSQQRQWLECRLYDVLDKTDEVNFAFYNNGCIKRSNPEAPNGYEVFPVSFKHATFPKDRYQEMKDLNVIQNELWAKMSDDSKFMLENVVELEKHDDFVHRFVNIYKKVLQCKTAQKIRCGISRNDYMMEEDGSYYQVELNLIAASLGPISESHLKGLQDIDALFGQTPCTWTNPNREFLTESLYQAFLAYGNPKAIMVMVAPKERNVVDQWAPSKELLKKGIKVKRFCFEELAQSMVFDDQTGIVSMYGEEIAFFYFRSGYMPDQYNEAAWKVREVMECSQAIKCPDVTLQLINMKYFQYVINFPETWTKFGYSKETFDSVNKTFKDIKIFSDFECKKEKLLEYIHQNGGPNNFVLKPQREGGGNNYFKEEILKRIQEDSEDILQGYILMELIKSKPYGGIFTNWKTINVRPVVDELGVFYFFLTAEGKMLKTLEGGSLVRSKILGTTEGGVAAGYAFINSVNVI